MHWRWEKFCCRTRERWQSARPDVRRSDGKKRSADQSARTRTMRMNSTYSFRRRALKNYFRLDKRNERGGGGLRRLFFLWILRSSRETALVSVERASASHGRTTHHALFRQPGCQHDSTGGAEHITEFQPMLPPTNQEPRSITTNMLEVAASMMSYPHT